MKNQGIWAVSFFAFLVAWRVLAAEPMLATDSKVPTQEFRANAAQWMAGDGAWTCYIERPEFYYIGFAYDRTDAVNAAIEACKEDGIVCTADEAVCQYAEDEDSN